HNQLRPTGAKSLGRRADTAMMDDGSGAGEKPAERCVGKMADVLGSIIRKLIGELRYQDPTETAFAARLDRFSEKLSAHLHGSSSRKNNRRLSCVEKLFKSWRYRFDAGSIKKRKAGEPDLRRPILLRRAIPIRKQAQRERRGMPPVAHEMSCG